MASIGSFDEMYKKKKHTDTPEWMACRTSPRCSARVLLHLPELQTTCKETKMFIIMTFIRLEMMGIYGEKSDLSIVPSGVDRQSSVMDVGLRGF